MVVFVSEVDALNMRFLTSWITPSCLYCKFTSDRDCLSVKLV